MTTTELKEYFGMIVQVEKEVDMQERLYRRTSNEISEYERSINNLIQITLKKNEPSKPTYEISMENEILAGISYSVWVIIFCMIVYHWVTKDGAVLLGVIAGIIIWGVFFLDFVSKDDKARKWYKETLKLYEARCDELKKEKNRAHEQIEELNVQKQTAEAYRQQVEKGLTSSRRNLEKMYSYNIVFPKYRNYVMVSSIYEYLCAGRCTTLEGHEGAYNILELEIRLDRIITQLDRILENLAAIRANQYTLYTCLQDTNQKMDALLKEESRMVDSLQGLGSQTATMNARLASLQRSSELTNYLAECNQRELHYMNRMNYLAGHYDNPFGNYAPV